MRTCCPTNTRPTLLTNTLLMGEMPPPTHQGRVASPTYRTMLDAYGARPSHRIHVARPTPPQLLPQTWDDLLARSRLEKGPGSFFWQYTGVSSGNMILLQRLRQRLTRCTCWTSFAKFLNIIREIASLNFTR